MSLLPSRRLTVDDICKWRSDQWIVCQLGARENYMIGRALASSGRLGALITDAWHAPRSLPARYIGRLRDRYHPQLAEARIETPGYKGIADELYERCLGPGGWRSIINRNVRFEEVAAGQLRTLVASGVPCDTVFAYSYAAAGIFRAARAMGLTTVLGQIDPGPLEDEIVGTLYRDAGQSSRYERIPDDYWLRWREEIALSDVVIANSVWSKVLLVRAGVPEAKISIVPLAYDTPADMGVRARSLPDAFTSERPLRLLFLGQVTLRKGIGPLLAALQRMPRAPLQLDIVGVLQVDIPDSSRNDPRIALHGAAPRSAVRRHYEAADLFVFPTLSDGFGLTQLEALAHGLPVLTSRNCGEVITHDHDGFVLDEVTSDAIESVLRQLLEHPARLRGWTERARIPCAFSQEALARALSRLRMEQ